MFIVRRTCQWSVHALTRIFLSSFFLLVFFLLCSCFLSIAEPWPPRRIWSKIFASKRARWSGVLAAFTCAADSVPDGCLEESTPSDTSKCSLPSTCRLCKDTVQSKKEIKSQEERIERVKVEEGKDEHDVRKQGEVLQEYVDGLADELTRLEKAWEELKKYIATLQEEQTAEMVEKITLTEEWTKAGAAVEQGRATLKENGKEIEDDEPMKADDDDEDDTVY